MDGTEKRPNVVVNFLKCYWRTIILIVCPIVLLPVFLVADNDAKNRCLYVVLVMAVFWMCEILPLPITSMFPIAFFPMMSILTTNKVCQQYFSETVVMFAAGIFLALAIEYSGLHVRIALKVMLIVGSSHLRLSFGIFFTTMFVSFWVSNTAAVAMMVPIVTAILQQLEQEGMAHMYEKGEDETPVTRENRIPSRTTVCYFLGIAYTSTIGGVATLVGTGTNLSLKGLFENRFPDGPPIDFGQWMVVHIPVALLNTLITWLYLNWMFLGLWRNSGMDPEIKLQKEEGKEAAKASAKVINSVIKAKYDDLGRITFHEIIIALLFLLAVFLWIFRSPGFLPGWADVIAEGYIQDASAAVFVVILMFAFPSTLDILRSCHPDQTKRPTRETPPALVWKQLHEKTPWGLMFLLGSGFAISEGSRVSGMSKFLGEQFQAADRLHPIALQIVASFAASMMTELSSNVAIANILLPILAELAVTIQTNPLNLMIPVAVCCSYAFMLPVGTPPNALVTGVVNISTTTFIITGIFPTIYTLLVTVFFYDTLGSAVYGFSGFPPWANSNATSLNSLS